MFSVVESPTTYKAISPDMIANTEAIIWRIYDFKSSPSFFDKLYSLIFTYRNTKDNTTIRTLLNNVISKLSLESKRVFFFSKFNFWL